MLLFISIGLFIASCASGPRIVVIPTKCPPGTDEKMKLAGFEEDIGTASFEFPIRKTTGVINPEKVTEIYVKICKESPSDKK
ncbi:MAG: hypothetical protein PHD51_01660 [Patescibacteria group bacterium]|nr:hypothetical protein [Patescibacteria group bacterium]MDD5490431.1 hypothetical protein [Patescibacteria group bacterium]